MTKPILLIRSSGNESDQQALAKFDIASEIDPYLVIQSITNSEPALGLRDSIKNASDPLLLITSLNAINTFVELIGEQDFRQTVASNQKVRVAAIGASTAARLKELGVEKVLLPASTNTSGIVELLAQEVPGTLIHPVGNLATEEIANALRTLGWGIHREVLYTNEVVPLPPRSVQAVQLAQYGAILFRSASAVRAFFHWNPTATQLKTAPTYFVVGKGALRELQLLGITSVEVFSPVPSEMAEEILNFLKEKDGAEK